MSNLDSPSEKVILEILVQSISDPALARAAYNLKNSGSIAFLTRDQSSKLRKFVKLSLKKIEDARDE